MGKGFFSDVYQGILSRPEAKLSVAIKMPKQGNFVQEEDAKMQRDILREELKIMGYLQNGFVFGGHENVLLLVGAITTNRKHFCLLTEYCSLGSMENFLQDKHSSRKFVNELILENTTVSRGQRSTIIQVYKVAKNLFSYPNCCTKLTTIVITTI